MKCSICKRTTNPKERFGVDDFVVCPTCYYTMVKIIERGRKACCTSPSIATRITTQLITGIPEE